MKTLEVKQTYLAEHKLAPSSIVKLENIFTYFQEFFPNDYPSIAGYINRWTKWLHDDKHLADISVQRHYTYMRSFANYMNEQYDLPNPFKKSIRPTYFKKPRVYFSPTQLALAIRSCKTDIERALTMGLIDSTCRAQDLSGLKGKDIVINDEHSGFLTNTDKKTGSHFYRLRPELAKVFKDLAGSDEGYVFKSDPYNPKSAEINKPASASAICHRIERILVRAGFKGAKLGAHTFRHSSASLIAKSTKSALAVKGVLGHADIETSMEYIHDAETEIAQAISPLQLVADQIMQNPNNPSTKQNELLLSEHNESTDIMTVQTEPSPADILLEESYPIPLPGTKINPRFNYDDICLIRRAFISLCNSTSAPNDPSDSRILYRRILRRTHPNKPLSA